MYIFFVTLFRIFALYYQLSNLVNLIFQINPAPVKYVVFFKFWHACGIHVHRAKNQQTGDKLSMLGQPTVAELRIIFS